MSDNFETFTNESNTNPGPSLQESYDALKKEGLITDDSKGAVLEDPDPVAQGGAEGTKGDSSDEERPSWLPEEFSSVEEFRAAYDKLKNGDSDEDAADDSDNEDDVAVSQEDVKGAADAAAKAGLNLADLQSEWDTDGAISDKSYEALEKAGYSREIVDTFVAGLAAKNLPVINAAYEIAGGQDGYNAIIDWAGTSLNAEQIAAFDAEVTSGSKTRALNAVKALKADFDAAKAKTASVEPTVTVSGKGSASDPVYASMADLQLDMDNPLYDQSPSFRKKVMEKLARSNIM